MIERVGEQFGLYPERLAADTAYGTAEILGWLVYKRGIEPHISVFDKSQPVDGTLSRATASMRRDSCAIGRARAIAIPVR